MLFRSGFVGYIDDVRFFAGRILSQDEVLRDYDHTLTGTENGLLAYWPLDEGVSNQRDAYDYSKTNSAPNENHGEIMPNGAIDHIVPDASQLSIYGQVENVFTITGYSGLDPEILPGEYGAHVDNGAYPRPRTFTLGVNLQF